MRLTYLEKPRAGALFHLSIVDAEGSVRTTWSVDGEPVETTECDDPPCYEEMYIQSDWQGRRLDILSMDSQETKRLSFIIAGTDMAPVANVGAAQLG